MNVVVRWLSFVLLFFILQYHPLLVQAAKHRASSDITLSSVRDNIEAIKHKTNLAEALKLRLLNAYYAAEDNLEELQMLEQQIQEAQEQLKTLPTEIKQLEKRIEVSEEQLKTQKAEDFSLYPSDELEQRLIIEKSNLNELQASISRLEMQLDEQLKWPQKIREKTAESKSLQVSLQQEKSALSTLIENPQELEARQDQLDSRSRKLNANLTWLEIENLVYPLRVQAKKLELQLLSLQVEQSSKLIKDIDDYLVERRQQEIEKAQTALIQAQKEADGKHPLIQEATRENIRYNRLLQETNEKLEKYLDQRNEIEQRYKQLENDFQSAEQKINLAGLSPALGNLLREQRRNLPLSKDFQNTFDKIQKEIALVSLELFQLDEIKKSLADMDKTIQARMSEAVAGDIDDAERLKIRTELRLLLNDQKELVFRLSSVYSNYSRTLADVDFALHQLVRLGEKFSHYLDQRLLWVPSAPVIDQHYLVEIAESLLWLTDIDRWRQLAVDIETSVKVSPVLALLGVVAVSIALWLRKKIKVNLQSLLENSSRPYVDRFSFTFSGLAYVFLLALPLPLLVAWMGWLLLSHEPAETFSHAVAHGLLAAAVPLLLIQFFYRLFKPKGVVQSLFYWHEHSIQLLHGQLKWIRFVVIPVIFLIGIFSDNVYSEQSYSLGRMVLIIGMLALAYMLHRLAHPVHGLAKDYYRENSDDWAYRLRYVWYGCLVLAPLSIIGFAIVGYYQSALELQHKMVIMLRLLFFAALLHEIVMRWMVLTNRQLALKNVRQKRKQQQEQMGDKDKAEASAASLEEEPLLDIPKINEQSRKLLQAAIIAIILVGGWLTLSDILPALSIFEQVVLWHHQGVVDGQETLLPVTLVNVFICCLYLLLMMVFVNNFPGLLDLLCAGRYRMTAGSRYALIQLTRYTVVTITFIAVANELGGSWSQVQWLVAAVSVGLGFGLQEIFANMVSGIILLFERPIRVGDTVTVGDISGKVCRIQMRATTIIDWDQKELVVPNKIFITDKLINWTLTDTVTRVVIPIGIAYGSDEEQVIYILKQVVSESALVLKDPGPQVFFVGFGDSSLDFSVRVYVRDISDILPVTDDVHRRVRRAFKEHDIEIPFPQRDLHIRSSVLPIDSGS
ncbi:mechanosensitive ion channel domain-containing protein [Methylomarinum sp. Ch1-1]|uniref:Mechanosensitive ion channel domain-containing protein n=1 Tax=Methylomarinum roseum TaxID=3067653 RepID=A0AAU7NZ03_9GAMM|nr:mechanosensitive ion channel domain-containing protein [Methylomarinum sp. Ch1-1]MDP4521656.1 mechanosensitive ion channel [Methylomarinum sp. Ch1-1]